MSVWGRATTSATMLLVGALGCDSAGGGSGDSSESGGSSEAAGDRPKIPKRCSPDTELTDEERYKIQQEIDDGKPPCPGMGSPELVIHTKGLTLNTERIEGGSYGTGNLLYIEPLFRKLKTNRERWKSFYPAQAFPGKLTLLAKKGVGSDVVISAMMSAAYAGYPTFLVRMGGQTDKLSWQVPGPPDLRGTSDTAEVFLEVLEKKGYQVGLHHIGAPSCLTRYTFRQLASPGSDEELKKWFADHCQGEGGKPCARRVRVRALDVPFADTMGVLRTVLAMPAFAETKPAVALTFQCDPPGPLFGRPGAAIQWGPRFPYSGKCNWKAAREGAGKLRDGEANVSGKLDPAVIQRVVRQNFGRFRLCYENGLRNDPNLQGRIAIRFVIAEDGTVKNVGGGGDIPDAGVISCVTRAFYWLTFPKPEGGIVTVSYPIVFTPEHGTATRPVWPEAESPDHP